MSDVELVIERLPSLPGSGGAILGALLAPEPDLRSVERIVRHDEGLTTAVLRRANSAACGVPGRTFNVSEAVTRLVEQIRAADAIVFGCPTYMGCVSAPFKAFMDATSKVWFEQAWRDKLAAGFTCAGALAGDKDNTLHTLVTFAAQHSMIWVTLGVLPSSVTPVGHPDAEADLNRMGASLGVMAQAGSAPSDQTPPESDRLTAERFGERLAQAAARWNAGTLDR